MGRASRSKGARREVAVVNAHRERGIYARRTPQSGANPDYGSHDIDIHWKGQDAAPLIAEVKGRNKLPAWLRGWLGENDVLILHEDRQERLYVVPERVWWEMVNG